ncbi:Hypothetical predicted protein [Olea europaea subsp. europaea]|uniref:Uncharacterized protein n=1 Tax=Olea europaea subsp. europaea TaxID=158383 RepID=A0A8S0T9L7_OLEEU|nr:Hypothetical predicted protein [Olea europaea subsp. europaea]
MAYTPSPRNCQEMPENQAVSLSRLGRVPDKAYTPCPQIAYKCLKIKLRPYHGQDTSRTRPKLVAKKDLEIMLHPYSSPDESRTLSTHRVQEIVEKYVKIRMTCTPYPRNYLEMLENQVESLPRPRRGPNIAYTLCSTNYLKIPNMA